MRPAIIARVRLCAGLGLAGCCLMLAAGCATQASVPPWQGLTSHLTPPAEVVSPREAWSRAHAHAGAAPRREVMVGTGGSMLPLYRDRTVLVVETMAMSELRRGMTVVFIGDRDRPVAHTLLEKTPGGWIAMGVGNTGPDRTRVQRRNYIGTVVRAFTPNPAVAANEIAFTGAAEARLAVAGKSGR